MGWQVLPGALLVVGCLTAGGFLRGQLQHYEYGKPKPTGLDAFQKALMERDRMLAEEHAAKLQELERDGKMPAPDL